MEHKSALRIMYSAIINAWAEIGEGDKAAEWMAKAEAEGARGPGDGRAGGDLESSEAGAVSVLLSLCSCLATRVELGSCLNVS